MKEKRVTKRAIFASLLSVAVCTSMLIGTSYAWFTDSVTSSNNKIVAGTLKVDLQVKGGNTGFNEYTSIKESSKPVFNYDLWEPGYTVWTNVKVVNEGSLALKYTLRFVSDDDLTKAKLADAIDVYYVPEDVAAQERPDFTTEPYVNYYKGTLAEVFSGTVDPIEDKLEEHQDADYATIVLKMKEKAGNEYQGEALPAFDLQLIAMQASYEKDTFGKDYDEKANGIPDHPEWGGLNTKASAKAVDGEDTVINGVGATLTIPAGAYDDGTAVAFEVKEGTTPGGIVIGDDNTAMTYDISVTPEETGSLKKVELNIGKGKSGLVVYHETTAMTKLTADNTTDEGYFYNPATGMLTIWSKKFSPFTIVTSKPSLVTLSEDKEEATAAVAAAVAAAEPGDTVVIGSGTADIPAGIPDNVVIKGQGADETVLHVKATNGDGYKTTAKDITISDITIDGSEVTSVGHNSVINVETDGVVMDNVVVTGGGQNTWNSSILVEKLKSGETFTLKNSTVSGSFRGILRESCAANIIVDNCDIDAVYPINVDGGSKPSHVEVSNSRFHGWTSYSSVDYVTFTNTEFSMAKSGYDVVAAYENTNFINCTFDSGFQAINRTPGFVWNFDNCVKDGVAITADNIKTMFEDSDIWNKSTCYVNGVLVPADEA